MMETQGLELVNVHKRLGGNDVVRGISLSVGHGELVCLLGPSGCGKTTTLRMIGGFLTPDSGRITIAGQDVTALAPERRPTAMVFQNYALWPHMTVFKNVAFGLQLRKRPKDEIGDRVAAALKMVNLSHAANRHPTALSGGEQQRVALARAIVLEPKLLLLDEPLSNLDAKLRVGVREEIREIQQRLQITTVFVTHDQDEALSVADRIAVMANGSVEQFSDPDTLYRRPSTQFVGEFVGAMNFFPGRAVANGVLLGEEELFVPCAPGAFADLPDPAARWDIAVRLEDVEVRPAGAPGETAAGATLAREVPHGHFKEILCQFSGKDRTVRAYVGSDVQLSGPLTVSFNRVLLYRDGILCYEYERAGRGGVSAPAGEDSAGDVTGLVR